MQHVDYVELFRDLAARHVDVLHTARKSHFARITLSSDPMFPMPQQIEEFLSGLSHKLLSPLLLLSSYDVDFDDSLSDSIAQNLIGRLIILEDVNVRDFNAEEAIYQRTAETGLDMLSEVYRELSDDPRQGTLDWNQVGSEKIRFTASRRNLAGTGYSFAIRETYTNLNRSAKFNPPA